MEEMLERELKWEVDEDFAVPRLDDIVADAEVQRSTVHLHSAYYDTADGDLQTHGVLLRRRDGDDDTGWQVKVPAADGRVEIRTALSDTPPPEITEMLAGMRLGKPLVNVATIRTVRDRYRITDTRRGRVGVEIDDDRVHASADHRLLAWREIEVDLGAAGRSMPARLANRFAKAGARPSRYPSKLARLSHISPSPTPGGTAASRALTAYLIEQIDHIFDGDLGLRRGSDPIHDTRVAIRRLRSTLRVFGKVLDHDAVGDELKWFAGQLGEVRDCQVQRRRFQAALEQLPPDLVLGPVANRIDNDLQSDQLRARQRLADTMGSQRYLELLATLQRWRTDPPMATSPSVVDLTKRARRAQRKADRRLVSALEANDDELLHSARKAAKRARYAAELLTPVDKKAKRTAKHYKQFQRVLGDHQDGVVASATLRRLARIAGTTPGENGFTFGLLFAREQQAADAARQQVRELIG